MGLIFYSLYSDLTMLTVTIVCLCIAYIKYCLTYWSRRGIEYAEPTFLFGSATSLLFQQQSLGEKFMELYKKYKASGRQFLGIYFLLKPLLILFDPELIKNIMIRDFQYFHDRGLPSDAENEPLSSHLILLEGYKWKSMREKLTPIFSSGKLKMMFETLLNCSNDLELILDEKINTGEAIDMKDIIDRFTTDVIGSVGFGIECNSLKDPDSEFRKYSKRIFQPNPLRWARTLLYVVFPKTLKFFGFSRYDKEVENFFLNVVHDTVNYREKHGVRRNDFLQLLIATRNTGYNKAEKNLTMNEIASNCHMLFTAGYETSSSTTTFVFYNLAIHQNIQDKLRKEISDVLDKYDGKLTYETVSEMTYLDMVLNESMRIFPTFSIILRKCTMPYKIPGSNIILEKGTAIVIPLNGLHTDSEYYPEPENFDPERFSTESESKRHPFTFLPFGDGPRNCIGLRFALLQTKVGIITLLKNHRFTLNEKTKTPFKMIPNTFINFVEGGIWLNAERI